MCSLGLLPGALSDILITRSTPVWSNPALSGCLRLVGDGSNAGRR